MIYIDDINIRSEYKLKIVACYFLSVIRFKLSVHDVTQTNLKKLDSLCDRFCKKWLSMPRSATPAIPHLSSGLNIKSISQLYKECHSINYVSSRLRVCFHGGFVEKVKHFLCFHGVL